MKKEYKHRVFIKFLANDCAGHSNVFFTVDLVRISGFGAMLAANYYIQIMEKIMK